MPKPLAQSLIKSFVVRFEFATWDNPSAVRHKAFPRLGHQIWWSKGFGCAFWRRTAIVEGRPFERRAGLASPIPPLRVGSRWGLTLEANESAARNCFEEALSAAWILAATGRLHRQERRGTHFIVVGSSEVLLAKLDDFHLKNLIGLRSSPSKLMRVRIWVGHEGRYKLLTWRGLLKVSSSREKIWSADFWVSSICGFWPVSARFVETSSFICSDD